MTIIEMLGQSGILAVLGMAIVFGFLFILIAVINLVGKVLKEKDQNPAEKSLPQIKTNGVDPQITAAISVAITEYQKK